MALLFPNATDAALHAVLREVRFERARQDHKWGEQDHDAPTWMSILMEEVGEVSQEVLKAKFDIPGRVQLHTVAMIQELIQTAAVAVVAVESLCRSAGIALGE